MFQTPCWLMIWHFSTGMILWHVWHICFNISLYMIANIYYYAMQHIGITINELVNLFSTSIFRDDMAVRATADMIRLLTARFSLFHSILLRKG